LPNSTSDLSIGNNIKVFPSITNDKVHITSPNYVKNVSIYSLQGTLVMTSNKDTTEIDISNLPNGMYLIEINTSNGRIIKQIIKK